jgi:hypothetical protein
MMPIKVEWVNQQHTIIHYNIIGNWTWDDYDAANAIATDMVKSVDHKVAIICDFSSSTAIPPRVLSNIGRSLRQKRSPNVSHIVTVGVSGLLRNLTDVLRTLYPAATADIIHAHTIDHAYRLIGTPGQTQA